MKGITSPLYDTVPNTSLRINSSPDIEYVFQFGIMLKHTVVEMCCQ
ncbi:hypothetical protein [uncultured Chryseobacterium sp.]|nr:hypothetical protein [uncultured Chryseobacterium sp.]